MFGNTCGPNLCSWRPPRREPTNSGVAKISQEHSSAGVALRLRFLLTGQASRPLVSNFSRISANFAWWASNTIVDRNADFFQLPPAIHSTTTLFALLLGQIISRANGVVSGPALDGVPIWALAPYPNARASYIGLHLRAESNTARTDASQRKEWTLRRYLFVCLI